METVTTGGHDEGKHVEEDETGYNKPVGLDVSHSVGGGDFFF
jgi:hypothetical protein